MSAIEWLGAISGLLCVWLTAKERISSFPIGLINIGFFAYMFFDAKLYADATLQIAFFLPLTLYGWYVWLHGKQNSKSVAVTRDISKSELVTSVCTFVTGSVIWAFILAKFTDAAVPWIDAPLAMASIVAQLLLSRKVIQNWLVWIVVDVFSIGMYAYKGLNITAVLYAVFLCIAVKGFLDWRKEQTYVAAKN